MDSMILFAVFLYFICAILLITEVFVPSGGLISILALACLIGGLTIFFNRSTMAGWIGIIVALVMIPIVLIGAYKLFPKTRFGRSITLEPPERRQGDAIPDTDTLKMLLGDEGVVMTPLRPVGMCDFSGRRIECVAEGGYIKKNTRVKVIKVEGTQLTVRAVEQS
jgi:membrane-bound ClpP family serine protease